MHTYAFYIKNIYFFIDYDFYIYYFCHYIYTAYRQICYFIGIIIYERDFEHLIYNVSYRARS